jgi:hypothetical protein
MAGFSVTVCLPAVAAPDVMAALGTALAPFGDASDSHWDRGYFWDSWRIAGGADGYGFWIAPGREADSRLIHDSPDYLGRAGLSLPGHCAGGPRELLDLSERPAVGVMLAGMTWDLWQRLAPDHPPALPQSVLADRCRPSQRHWFDSDAVHAEFEAQPLVRAFRAAHPLDCVDPALFSAESLVHPDHLMMFAADREGFVEDVARQSFGGWDLLTLDGFWIDSDNLDVSHGACGLRCGHVPADASLDLGRHGFAEARRRYLQAIPEESLLVRVRGHY